jgi:hypothetical protein
VVDNEKIMRATMIGSLKCKLIQVDGITSENMIHELTYVNKALKKGFKISN